MSNLLTFRRQNTWKTLPARSSVIRASPQPMKILSAVQKTMFLPASAEARMRHATVDVSSSPVLTWWKISSTHWLELARRKSLYRKYMISPPVINFETGGCHERHATVDVSSPQPLAWWKISSTHWLELARRKSLYRKYMISPPVINFETGGCHEVRCFHSNSDNAVCKYCQMNVMARDLFQQSMRLRADLFAMGDSQLRTSKLTSPPPGCNEGISVQSEQTRQSRDDIFTPDELAEHSACDKSENIDDQQADNMTFRSPELAKFSAHHLSQAVEDIIQMLLQEQVDQVTVQSPELAKDSARQLSPFVEVQVEDLNHHSPKLEQQTDDVTIQLHKLVEVSSPRYSDAAEQLTSPAQKGPADYECDAFQPPEPAEVSAPHQTQAVSVSVVASTKEPVYITPPTEVSDSLQLGDDFEYLFPYTGLDVKYLTPPPGFHYTRPRPPAGFENFIPRKLPVLVPVFDLSQIVDPALFASLMVTPVDVTSPTPPGPRPDDLQTPSPQRLQVQPRPPPVFKSITLPDSREDSIYVADILCHPNSIVILIDRYHSAFTETDDEESLPYIPQIMDRMKTLGRRAAAAGYIQKPHVPMVPSRRITYDSDMRILGKGLFGDTVSGTLDLEDGKTTQVVVKRYFISNSRAMYVFEKEVKMNLCIGDCSAVPRLHGLVPVFEEDKLPFGIILGKVGDGTTLFNLMYENPGPNKEQWIFICYRLAKHLAAIHSRGILHCDLKTDNVVVMKSADSPAYEPVIIDLGNASIVCQPTCYPEASINTKRNGNHFLAPEIRNGCQCSQAGDVWSLGIMIGNISSTLNIPELGVEADPCLELRPHLRATASSAEASLRSLCEKLGMLEYTIDTTLDSDEPNERSREELEAAGLIQLGVQILPKDDPLATVVIEEIEPGLVLWEKKPPGAGKRWKPSRNALGQELVKRYIVGNRQIMTCAAKTCKVLANMERFMFEASVYTFLNDTDATPAFFGLASRRCQPLNPVLLFEYIDGVTLGEFIRFGPALSKEEWIILARKICMKLHTLHLKGFVVNAIKDTKILIDNQHEPFFVDLGLSTYKKGYQYESDITKHAHLAPEVRRGHRTSVQADIFSIGYILQQIMWRGRCLTMQETVGCCLQEEKDSRPDMVTVLLLLEEASTMLYM